MTWLQLGMGDRAQVRCGGVSGTDLLRPPELHRGHFQKALGSLFCFTELLCLSPSRCFPSPNLFPNVMTARSPATVTPLPSPSHDTPASCSWEGIGCQVWGANSGGTKLLFTVVLGTCWQGPAGNHGNQVRSQSVLLPTPSPRGSSLRPLGIGWGELGVRARGACSYTREGGIFLYSQLHSSFLLPRI